MTFALSKILWGLTAPGNLLTLLLVLGLVFQRVGWPWLRGTGRGFMVVSAMGFLALATLPVGEVLMKPLESRFSPPQLPERVDGIIVLGGAVAPTVSKGRGQPAVNQAAERLIEFAGLARHYPAARLVFTGGSGQLTHQDTPEVPVARTALERMGLDPARVLFEGESRNTWENALYSLDLVKPSEGEVWVLVTSAYHMPRSVGIFRRVGWRVVPYPVDYRTQLDPDFPRFDLIWGMDLASDAIREWIGLAAYRLMGRTDSLFPKPG